jgi:hypothetical protein
LTAAKTFTTDCRNCSSEISLFFLESRSCRLGASSRRFLRRGWEAARVKFDVYEGLKVVKMLLVSRLLLLKVRLNSPPVVRPDRGRSSRSIHRS